MKGSRYPNVEVFRQTNWNGITLGQRRSENGENRS